MISRGIGSCISALLLGFGVTAAADVTLVEQWGSPAAPKKSFGNILVIAITDQRETRHRFEDKFVSHLRGRGIEGVTSYSIVPDLQTIGAEEREAIFQAILDGRIDGAISLRLVPLDDREEAAWSAEWLERARSENTLRELIEDTLPVATTDAKRYGVEVTLWGAAERSRFWSGRTGPHKPKQLRKSAGSFVQLVIRTLKDARRL